MYAGFAKLVLKELIIENAHGLMMAQPSWPSWIAAMHKRIILPQQSFGDEPEARNS